MRYGVLNINSGGWCSPFDRPFFTFTRDINEAYKSAHWFRQPKGLLSPLECMVKEYDKDVDMSDEEIYSRFENELKLSCKKLGIDYVPPK